MIKKILILAIVLAVGLGIGYYAGMKKAPQIAQSSVNKKAVELKLGLLKTYLNFVMLPEEKIADPDKYAADMEKIAVATGDEDLLAKYRATGEEEKGDQKMLDFFNYLIESVRAEIK